MTHGTYTPNLNQHCEYINYSLLTAARNSQNLTVAAAAATD